MKIFKTTELYYVSLRVSVTILWQRFHFLSRRKFVTSPEQLLNKLSAKGQEGSNCTYKRLADKPFCISTHELVWRNSLCRNVSHHFTHGNMICNIIIRIIYSYLAYIRTSSISLALKGYTHWKQLQAIYTYTRNRTLTCLKFTKLNIHIFIQISYI